MNNQKWVCDICKKYYEDVYCGFEIAKKHEPALFDSFMKLVRKQNNIKPKGKVEMYLIQETQICRNCLLPKEEKKS